MSSLGPLIALFCGLLLVGTGGWVTADPGQRTPDNDVAHQSAGPLRAGAAATPYAETPHDLRCGTSAANDQRLEGQ